MPAGNSPRRSSQRATTPTLLRILHYLTANASSNVADALEHLSDALDRHPTDAAALRRARHRITRLFSSFLKHFYSLPPSNRLSKPLTTQLVARFNDVADDIDLSDPVLHAVRHAIRTVAACRFALDLIRSKYGELVDTTSGPSSRQHSSTNNSESRTSSRKRYKKLFKRLLHVADDKTREEFDRLLQVRDHMQAKGVRFPSVSRALGHSLEKMVVHVVKKHSRNRGEIEHHALETLGPRIARKFSRRGFHDHFADQISAFVGVMASDENVVIKIEDWIKKKKLCSKGECRRSRYGDTDSLRRHNSERTADFDDPLRRRLSDTLPFTPKVRSRSAENSPSPLNWRLRSSELGGHSKLWSTLDRDFSDLKDYRVDRDRYEENDHPIFDQYADPLVLNQDPYGHLDSYRARPSFGHFEDPDNFSDSSSVNSDSTSRSQWARVRTHRRALYEDIRQPQAWSDGEELRSRRHELGRGRSRSPKKLYDSNLYGMHRGTDKNTRSPRLSAFGASERSGSLKFSRRLRNAKSSLMGDRFSRLNTGSDDGGTLTDNTLASVDMRDREGLDRFASPGYRRWRALSG